MAPRYVKTDAGRAEIRARALPLSRPARTLLLILDANKTADEWLAAVQGTSPADFEHLAAQGLIEPAVAATPAVRAARTEPAAPSVLVALHALAYAPLYDLLTSQAKARFGLIKGYRLVLDIEKCANLQELQAVGSRFVDRLQKEQGEAGLKAFGEALAASSAL